MQLNEKYNNKKERERRNFVLLKGIKCIAEEQQQPKAIAAAAVERYMNE
jgi:hypothetical protein